MWDDTALDTAGRRWPRPDLRVGDADRQRVVAELQRHFVDGRLSSDELSERVGHALAVRTFGELARVLGDLPALPEHRDYTDHRAARAGPSSRWRQLATAPHLGLLLLGLALVFVVWLVVAPGWHAGMLPFWPILIWGFFSIGGGRPRRGPIDDE